MIPFIENLPERHAKCSCEFFQGLDIGDSVAVLDSGAVTAKKAGAFFDVALALMLRFAELP